LINRPVVSLLPVKERMKYCVFITHFLVYANAAAVVLLAVLFDVYNMYTHIHIPLSQNQSAVHPILLYIFPLLLNVSSILRGVQGFALQLLCRFAGVYTERHGGGFSDWLFAGLFSKALAFLTLARAS
jgi:hypothetical protein